VLILARQFVPLVGGTERQAQRYGAALARRGACVSVLTARLDPNWPQRERLAGCEIVRLKAPRIRLLGTAVWMARVFFEVLARSHRVDILHVFWAKETALAALAAGKLARLPVIVRPAGGGRYGEVGVARCSLWRRLGFALLRTVDGFVALSTSIADELASLGLPRARIHVIPNGIEIERKPPWRSRPCRAVFVGRLSEEKNLERLLHAWKRVVTALPDATLELAGDGPLRARLESLATELGIAEAVELDGYVDDVKLALARARVFVQPSISEGMSAALVEALAAGLPVVVTPTSGATDLVEEGVSGRFVPREDPGRIADVLIDVLRDEEKARAMGERARDTARRRCDIETIVDQHLDLYEDLSHPRRSHRSRTGVLMVIATLDNAGSENQMALLAAGLAQKNVSVKVVCLTRLGPLEPNLREAGVQVNLLRKRGKIDLRAFGRLLEETRRARSGVVHTWLYTSNSYGRLAAVLARARVIVASERSLDPYKRPAHVLIDRILARATGRVVANARAVRDVLIERGIPPERIDVIPNAVATGDPDQKRVAEIRQSLALGRGPVVGYVGRLSHEKGPDLLIEAFRRASGSHPQARLLIVGDGPQRPKLELSARDLIDAGRVLFVGEVSDATDYYGVMDVFVLPSRYEGLPNAVIEAAAAGRAIVAADVGGVREIIQDGKNGCIAPAEDVDRMSEALAALLGDPEQRRRLAERAGETARRTYARDAMVDAYLRVYEDASGERPCRR